MLRFSMVCCSGTAAAVGSVARKIKGLLRPLIDKTFIIRTQ